MPEIVSNSQQSSPSRGSSGNSSSSGGGGAMMRCNQDRSPTKTGPDRNSFTNNQAGSAVEVRLKRQLDDCERRRKDLVVLNQKSESKKRCLVSKKLF
jgi:hypothetical protein